MIDSDVLDFFDEPNETLNNYIMIFLLKIF